MQGMQERGNDIRDEICYVRYRVGIEVHWDALSDAGHYMGHWGGHIGQVKCVVWCSILSMRLYKGPELCNELLELALAAVFALEGGKTMLEYFVPCCNIMQVLYHQTVVLKPANSSKAL